MDDERRERERAWTRRAFLGSVAIGSAALGLAGVALVEERGDPVGGGRARYVAIDRGADRLYALDGELAVIGARGLPCPAHAAFGGGRARGAPGDLWAASLPERWAGGRAEVVRVGRGRRARRVATLEHVRALHAAPEGGLAALAGRAGDEHLVLGMGNGAGGRVGGAEPERIALPGARRLALGEGGRWLVATATGLFAGTGARLEVATCEDEPRDVAPDRGGAGWWCLSAGGLRRLDAELATLEERGVHGTRLVPPSSGRVDGTPWVLDGERRRAVRRERGGSRVEARWRAAGASSGLATADGGLLVVTPGALLRFDAEGRIGRGQGGFRELVGVVALGAVRKAVGRVG